MTWRQHHDGPFPSTRLPSEIPDSRILSCDYGRALGGHGPSGPGQVGPAAPEGREIEEALSEATNNERMSALSPFLRVGVTGDRGKTPEREHTAPNGK